MQNKKEIVALCRIIYNTNTFLNRKEYFLGADQMSMITIVSPKGQTIHTDSCPEIQRIIESEGVPWFEALQKPVNVSKKAFDEIDSLISKPQS